MIKENLQKASEKMANKFKELIVSHPDAEKADISNALMARMCLETIYLTKEVVDGYETSATVTINPSNALLKSEWEGKSDAEKDNYYKIRAYSFGPFNPIEYFKSEFKILWLLKEPYCESIAEIDGTEIKDFRQSIASYTSWKRAKGNPTIRNVIKITQTILLGLKESGKYNTELKNEDLEDLNNVMNHICILEVNHFPGLAFNGTDSNDELIREWKNINKTLIDTLIKFYLPNIVITSFDGLSCFVDNYDKDYEKIGPVDIIKFMTSNSYDITSSSAGYPSALLYGQRIKPFFNEHNIIINKTRKTKFGPVAIFDPSDRIWIGWYHTSARKEMSNDNIVFIGNWISELIKRTGV